jgi:hypothetical protein
MVKHITSSRIIEIKTNEELEEFVKELRELVISNNYRMDTSVENWLDLEFNRIYVAYAYPDVTKVN